MCAHMSDPDMHHRIGTQIWGDPGDVKRAKTCSKRLSKQSKWRGGVAVMSHVVWGFAASARDRSFLYVVIEGRFEVMAPLCALAPIGMEY